MDHAQITEIQSVATQVAAQYTETQAAFAAERDAEAALLTAAITAARPALRAISSRILEQSTTTGLATDRQREHTSYRSERGLLLAGVSRPQRDAQRDNSGSYEGCALYLLTDGTLACVVWSGHWSRWQGSSDEQESRLTALTPREAMDTWDCADVITEIHDALAKQLAGKAAEKATAARARAAKLQAILALL